MKIIVTDQFYKDLKSTGDNKLKNRIIKTIDQIKEANQLSGISNVRKLKHGVKNYYRIRIGDYRLGFELEKMTVYLLIFRHRKDFYRKFP